MCHFHPLVYVLTPICSRAPLWGCVPGCLRDLHPSCFIIAYFVVFNGRPHHVTTIDPCRPTVMSTMQLPLMATHTVGPVDPPHTDMVWAEAVPTVVDLELAFAELEVSLGPIFVSCGHCRSVARPALFGPVPSLFQCLPAIRRRCCQASTLTPSVQAGSGLPIDQNADIDFHSLMSDSDLSSMFLSDFFADIPSTPDVPQASPEADVKVKNRGARVPRAPGARAARQPRKRDVKKKQPERRNFASDADFELAHLAWREARAKNNESVKRSREKARDRYNHTKKRLRSVDEERLALKSEAQFLERCVGIMVKAVASPLLLTAAEKKWLAAHLGQNR